MISKNKVLVAALGLLGAFALFAQSSEAGICFSNSSPWNARYTCTRHGTIDTRDSCSPFFPGGAPICVPRLSVQKNSGISTSAQGLNAAGSPIAGCSGFDSVADGVAVIRGAECSQAKAVKYEVRF